ncbi:acyl-CoA dehydrogenase family protein [Micromonospora echinofusca]|uniref:Acyl-CoA dehydrogenase n=1 Tax=Micromonospora echinofusca TaxID=47858 RepID=A0ABS3VQH6_MICEH|nr:acyl-CoA dehydrogenase family protein [Micromonospora echinofusca]MBO4206772.1 hypothetical protein [Micromonospora echinofusca]
MPAEQDRDAGLVATLAAGAVHRDRDADLDPAVHALLDRAEWSGGTPLDTPAARLRAVRRVRDLARVDAGVAHLVAGIHRAGALAAGFHSGTDPAAPAGGLLACTGPVVPSGASSAGTGPVALATPTVPVVPVTSGPGGLVLTGTWRLEPPATLARQVVLAGLRVDGHDVVALLDVAADGIVTGPAAPNNGSGTEPAGVVVGPEPPAFGLRAAPTAELRLTGLPVPAHRIRPLTGQPTWPVFDEALRIAVEVGLLDGFLAAARDFLVHHARPWHESGVDSAARDPHTTAVLGQAYAQQRALHLLARDAFAAVATADGTPGGAPPRAVVLARWYARQRIGPLITSVVGVLGASGTSGRFALDRYWRDFRTHALRHPPRWGLDTLDHQPDPRPEQDT